MRVLIVEDSPSMGEALRRVVEGQGLEVVAICACEDDALAVLDREARESAGERAPIAAAIVDLQLAQGTGFGVMRRLRERGAPPCAIVAYTSHAVAALKVASFEAGADYFLDKSRGLAPVEQVLRLIAAAAAVRA